MDEGVSYDNRKALRIAYKGAVRFSADQFHWYVNTAQNISKEGIFIKTGEIFTLGTNLYLHIDLTVDAQVVKKIRTIGKVVRLAGSEEPSSQKENTGIGIHFFLLPSQKRIIRDFAKDVVNSRGRYVMMHGQKGGTNPDAKAYRHPDGRFNMTNGKDATEIRVPTYGLTDNTKAKDVDQYIKKVANQFLILLESELPEDFFHLSACPRCGFIGQSEFEIIDKPWMPEKVFRLIYKRGQTQRVICPECKRPFPNNMSDYEGRKQYLATRC